MEPVCFPASIISSSNGTYQLGNRQLLEFQTNYSHERMHVERIPDG